MPLARGTRIGPYEIVAGLGAGAMGEVYRARDPRLDRDVAIKLLPEAFVADVERVARFQREAKTLASLNHPNIAAIYGLEDTAVSGADVRALVIELVEGPTLADRIARGPLPEDEVLGLAKQIADALEVAHEQGIIHRDLKPANIKVRDDGTVKVLDFGLAKVLAPPAAADLENSPTITSSAMTERGVILGTAAYMAPEQARGKPVDKRADIWAFGAVLYEMLTGRRAFAGEDASDTLANILKQEPKYDGVPTTWRPLLQRCLAKNPKKRLRDIGDALVELDGLADRSVEATHEETVLRRRVRLWRIAAIVAGAAGIAAAGLAVRPRQNDAPASSVSSATFDVALPPETTLMLGGQALAITPDGRTLVYVAGHGGVWRLFRRELEAIATKPFEGRTDTRGAAVSPDGQSLLLISDVGRISTIPAAGGPAQVLCVGDGNGVTWLDDSSIVFGRGGLFRTPRTGCVPEALTTVEKTGLSAHRWPTGVPGSGVLLYTSIRVDRGESKIVALDLTTREQHEVIDGTFPRFVAPSWLFFARRDQDGTPPLLVAPFDPRTARVMGPPAVVADDVGLDARGAAQYAVSSTGTLAYALSAQPVVRIINRSGDVLAAFPVGQEADMIAVSPDGRRAVVTFDSRIDVIDLERGLATRVAFERGQYKFPVWLPDGRRISYRYQAVGQSTYQVISLDLARGTRDVVMTVAADPEAGGISAWSSDGRTAFGNYVGPGQNHDLFRLSLDGNRQIEPIVANPGLEANARLSPDGRLLAFLATYQSQVDIFVQPVDGGERVRVSTEGGLDPNWSPIGRELFYRQGSRIYSALIATESGRLSVRSPQLIAERPLHGRLWSYGIMPDGRRLVTLERAAPVSALRVVLNWPRLIGRDGARPGGQ